MALRLITPEERQRFDEQIVRGHYLHNAQFVGRQPRYVAEYQGQWVALMIWSAGAYKLKLREEWIRMVRPAKEAAFALGRQQQPVLLHPGAKSRSESGQQSDET